MCTAKKAVASSADKSPSEVATAIKVFETAKKAYDDAKKAFEDAREPLRKNFGEKERAYEKTRVRG